MRTLLMKHSEMFAAKMSELGETNVLPFKINTVGKPFAVPPYRCPVNLQPVLKVQLGEMLSSGIIKSSSSPYSSPPVLATSNSAQSP